MCVCVCRDVCEHIINVCGHIIMCVCVRVHACGRIKCVCVCGDVCGRIIMRVGVS